MKKYLFTILVMGYAISQVSAQVAIISNKNVNFQISDIQEVIDIYTLEKRSAGGVTLVVFDMKNDDVKSKLLSAIGKTSTELKKIWMRVQLTGDGKVPAALENETEVVAKVASVPGAIGYVSQEKVTDAVKTLFIIK
jgi:hypothetical protein